jgi:hypothetical protein
MIDKCDPQEICRLASEALATSSVQEIRGLNVLRERDTLKVSGSVGSFYHKQLALRDHSQCLTRNADPQPR